MVKPASKRAGAKRGPAARDRDGDTEQRILDAAHSVFVRRGTAGARMQEIAAEAGVNKALLHYYFRTKSRLAEAVFRRVAAGLFARLGAILGADEPLERKIERAVALYLDQLSATPYAPGYVISEVNQHPERSGQLLDAVRQIRDQTGAPNFLTALGAQLGQRARAGDIRPIPPEQFIVNLVALCVFPFAARPLLCTILQLDDKGFQRFIAQRKTTLPRFFLGGLRP
jgi:TetR/AcrR family transcriptional regulator